MSWHISSVISKGISPDTRVVTSYVHLLDSCNQDWFSVTSVLEHLLSTLKDSMPNITKAFVRSDEAGCYHSNNLIASLKDVGDRVGISVESYDFSEPQYGKDICDRIICPLKSAIRRFCDEGNDILTAQDMHKALCSRQVKGTTSAVVEINDSVKQLDINKIKGFSNYHNFKYEEGGIRVWRSYGIGSGKKISYKSLYKSRQAATELHIKTLFGGVQMSRPMKLNTESEEDADADGVGLFDCPEAECNRVFARFDDLKLHLIIGQHTRFSNKESVYDAFKREWAKQHSTLSAEQVRGRGKARGLTPGGCSLGMGWALNSPKTGKVRFSEGVRKYLEDQFEAGEKTGNKADPARVVGDMRTAKDEYGNRLFVTNEWLNAQQIKSFFSRFASKRRKEYLGAGNAAEKEETEKFLESDTDEELELETQAGLLKEIVMKLDVSHPILYKEYNLCDLYNRSRLSSFTKPLLRDICKYFSIAFKTKDRKDTLVQALENMVRTCSCCSKG